jgi:hypothetical protein
MPGANSCGARPDDSIRSQSRRAGCRRKIPCSKDTRNSGLVYLPGRHGIQPFRCTNSVGPLRFIFRQGASLECPS